jgi:hypothetical protein
MANTTPTTPPSRIAPEWERDTSVSVLAHELETERTTSPPTVSEPENVPVPQRVRAAPGKNPRFCIRTPLQRAEDEQKAVAMHLAGKSQPQIAQALGVAQSTITLDLKRVRLRWEATLTEDMAQHKAAELQTIAHIQGEALTAWHQSKRTNAKFLDIALKASLRRARLLGLDADIPHHLPSPEIGDVNALQIRLEKYSAMFSMPVHDGASIVELPSADGAHTNGSYSDPAENIP